MKNKIYIAGKITGREIEAKIEFKKAENHLKDKGWEVVNPMELPHNHDKKWISYMRECIKELLDCDSIYFLPNWEDSRGAKIEHNIASDLNYFMFFEN
jgi:nucleoside 2-deoxyribosyltransferase